MADTNEKQSRILTINMIDGSKQRIHLREEFFMKNSKEFLSQKQRVEKIHSLCSDVSNRQYVDYNIS